MKIWKIAGIVMGVGSFLAGITGIAYLSQKSLKKESELQQRYRAYYTITNQWLCNKNEGKKLSDYLKDNDINTIAVYGTGTMCEILYGELKDSDIEIAYFIDKNVEEGYEGAGGIPVINLDGIAQEDAVDAIVVTPVFDFDTINVELEEKQVDAPVISLEEIVYGV